MGEAATLSFFELCVTHTYTQPECNWVDQNVVEVTLTFLQCMLMSLSPFLACLNWIPSINSSHCTSSLWTVQDDCETEPCQNGGVCTDLLRSFYCNCSGTGYTGNLCQERSMYINDKSITKLSFPISHYAQLTWSAMKQGLWSFIHLPT